MRKQITLYADKGKILTDGENYASTVSLAVGADENKYYEITEEEYNEKMKEIDTQNGVVY